MPHKMFMCCAIFFIALAGAACAEDAGPPLLPDTTIGERDEFIKSIGDTPGIVPHIGDRLEKEAAVPPPEAVAPALTIPTQTPDNFVRRNTNIVAPLPALAPVNNAVVTDKKPEVSASKASDKVTNKSEPTKKISEKATASQAAGRKTSAGKKVTPQPKPPVSVRKEGIMTVIRSYPGLEKLTKLIQSVGLRPMLDTRGKYTLFAPRDSAFRRVSAQYLAELEQPKNRDVLLQILANHIIGGHRLTDAYLKEARRSPVTMAAQYLTFTHARNGVQVNRANIVGEAIHCSNGVIYIVDQVMLPTSTCKAGGATGCE